MIDVLKDDAALLHLLATWYPDLNTIIGEQSYRVKTVLLVETPDKTDRVIAYDGKSYYLLVAAFAEGERRVYIGSEDGEYNFSIMDYPNRSFEMLYLARFGYLAETLSEEMLFND